MTERVAVPHAGADRESAIGTVAAGRYRIEQELARGGMGTVYSALDAATGKRVALKRVQDQGQSNRALLALFEREYCTLRSLRHPRIIEVYDYGVDRDGAYYTMELLDGSDLGTLAPLGYLQACAYLRDIASSLALLHARKLLHRDVSPNNVRVTEDGRCKLLDFGALAGFGIASQVVGTPPCIPPEAVRGAPLDQRADLYSLGATAYYLLTGRHAYGARRISELKTAWLSPVPRPSQYAPDLPAALDELVMSLLHPDPLARPESAAEVIDRLNAVAGLPVADEPHAAASYFFSTELVARQAELARIQAFVGRAVGGAGGAVVVHGSTGTGRSRLLLEACVQAQLAGATVLQVDAERERRENGTALALAHLLLEAVPEEALQAAAPHADVLVHVLPGLEHKLDVKNRAAIPETPGEWRGRVQAALTGFVSAVCEARALIIAVDNLEAADDASSALLAALAADAGGRKLLVLAALRADRTEGLPSGVRLLCELSETIELTALTADQTVALARAMFGDVPNVLHLGEWLFRASQGVVSHAFELATELVRRGTVRYVGGTWMLPQNVSVEALPTGIAEALEQRIARLPAPALELAEALSVHGSPLGIELCRSVAEALDMPDVFVRLDALVEHDVLQLAGDRYRFRPEAMRPLVLERVEPARRKRLHRTMGQALLATAAPDDLLSRVEAGWQLLRGGEELRGAQLLDRTAMAFEIGTGSLQAAIPALEEARRVYLQHHRSLYELLPIVTRLAAEGYYSDRRLSTLYADEAFALLRKATGLDLAEKLRPFVGRKLGVYLGLAYAALRFFATPRSRRTARFSDVFVLLVNCVTTQAGAGTVCLDTEAMRRAAAFIEPLTVLGPRHITSAIHEYCLCLMQMSLEREPEVRRGWLALLERLSDAEQFQTLPDYVRQLYRGGALFALGIVETWRDGEEALARAHELESLGLRIYDRAANQIRMLYHAGRGELEQAERYRKRMELHAVQTGSAWQVEVTVPLTLSVVYSALGDVVGLKRVSEQIEQLARRFQSPSLERTAKLARAVHLLASGSAEAALAIYDEVLSATEVRSFVGWARALGYRAEAYNRLGRHADALRACEDALRHVRAEDRVFVRMFLVLEVQHALAEAGLGRTESAAMRLQALIAEHEPNQGPLTLGLLHEARARVALAMRDQEAFMRHIEEAERFYRPTQAPGLIARVERLMQQAEDGFGLPRAGSSARPASTIAATRSLLSQCTDGRQRAERALDLILQESGVREGHLFLVDREGELTLAASRSAFPPAASVRSVASELYQSFTEDADATRILTRVTAPAAEEHGQRTADEFRHHLLWCTPGGRPEVVGVVALRADPAARALAFHLLQAVAEGLRAPEPSSSSTPPR